MSVEVTECPECGAPFAPGPQQKYCTARCKNTASARAWRERNRPTKVQSCAECGGPVQHLDVGRPRRFCSEKCKAKATNTRQRRALLPLRDRNPDERACAHCGDPFVPKRRDRIYCYGKYCPQLAYQARKGAGASPRVATRTVSCDGCGTTFVATRPEARWCSKQCANRHWGNVRARQRGALSQAKYTDREIFERDGWRCHICKKKVRRDVDRLHPEGATIDHLVPISEGGVDEPSNVATAHWKCNRDKGSGSANDQLALI